jgi:hypothetical protein
MKLIYGIHVDRIPYLALDDAHFADANLALWQIKIDEALISVSIPVQGIDLMNLI